MAWLIGIGIIAFLCYKFPTFRVIILVVGGIAVLGIAWLLYSDNHQQQVAKTLIPINQIQLTNVRLGQGNFRELSGEARNNSSYELTGINLVVKAFDCPTDSITADCVTIGQDNNVSIYIDVPPNQVRGISSAYVSLNDMPPIKGRFLWSYDITGTTGK